MKKKLINIWLWIFITYKSIMTNIAIMLYNIDVDIFKVNPDGLDSSKKLVYRMRNRSRVLNNMDQGIKDEKFVKDFYETLKKADLFMKNATPHKMAVVADRYSILAKDPYSGKDIDTTKLDDETSDNNRHFGFYHKSNKNFGKTLNEVLEQETLDRRVDDDDYPLLYIYDNTPHKFGFTDLDKLTVVDGDEVRVLTEKEISSKLIFPISIRRSDDTIVNKIEMLTQTLHVKRVAFNTRLFEFLIPNKYKLNELYESSPIWDELKMIDQIYMTNKYGEMTGFKIDSFFKTFQYGEYELNGESKFEYTIIKFKGIEMNVDSGETIGENIENENNKIII